MPSSQDYKTVSHLYEAIRANLTAFVIRSGTKSLFIGPESGQVDPELIRIHGIGTITDLESVNRAIDIIVEQGEGSPGDREDSHYRRFQAVKQEYADLLGDNPGFRPAYPVAENPVMRRPSEPEGKIYIDAEPAAMILDIANALTGCSCGFSCRPTLNRLPLHRRKNVCCPPLFGLCTSSTRLQKLWRSSPLVSTILTSMQE